MSNNRVTRLFMAVMVAGALVGCGSKEVAQETTPVAEATVEATVEENAVDAAASTEESIAAEATEEASIEENAVEENTEVSEYTWETFIDTMTNANYYPYGAFYYYTDDDAKCIIYIDDADITSDDYLKSSTAYLKNVEDDVDFYNVIESLNSVEDFINDPAVRNMGQQDIYTLGIIKGCFDDPENACITEFNTVNLPLKLTFGDIPYYIVWFEAITEDAPSSESSTQE